MAMMVEEKKLEMGEVQALLSVDDDRLASRRRRSSAYERLVQPCLAELVGTAFFVFMGCVSVIEDGGPEAGLGRLQPALVHGLAVAVMVACMAEISLAIYLCGGMEMSMVPPYVVSQLLGGVLGASMAKAMTSAENYAKAQGAAFTLLQSEQQLGGALFGEIAMTSLLTLVVLLGAVNATSRSPLVPFTVGCSVILSVLAGGGVSGTCLNAARALGPALLSGYWSYHWVYWVGPLAGALVGAALVRLLLGDRDTRVLMK
ncbi:hypothetical protein NHX12_032697 [Muraenolepis orangiensis]|uniref:Aquaporin 8 n=1 Tax=Muraenolepis orangiensis TaxID=630683 RepID=A0A9Q0EAA5_9TELE|nr:hypothetical protein NHX12_032697 [Muraenolepis orangiensis]